MDKRHAKEIVCLARDDRVELPLLEACRDPLVGKKVEPKMR